MSKKRLFLIDGNSFCYRAFYAIRALSNSKGMPTNAIYGFITMLKKLINDEKPDMLAIAFDLKGPTFRHEKYGAYKAHRKPMPDDLVGQLPHIKDAVAAYRIPMFAVQGVEADDVLATLAKKASRRGIDTYIVTGDKDALQLVSEDIRVYNTHKERIIDEAAVKLAFGVEPKRVVDIMALMGDATDNIPGVSGIGEKTAIELIGQFGSLEALLGDLDNVKSLSRRKLLREHEAVARLSKELATLNCDVDIAVDFDDLALKEPDRPKLVELFREFEFKALLMDAAPKKALNSHYELIQTDDAFDTLISELNKLTEFAVDFETTSEDPTIAELVGISFTWETGKAFYVGLCDRSHADHLAFDKRKLDREEALKKLKKIFEDEQIKKIGQNIKYEFIVLSRYGIRLDGIGFDTMVASYVLNPSKFNHNLEDICFEYLGHRMTTPIEELIGKGKSATTMDLVDIEKVCSYCCEDSDVTFRLKAILEAELLGKGLTKLFYEVEMPLIKVLAAMEMRGVAIDRGYLGSLSHEMEGRLKKITSRIYELAGEEFNINSPKQLSAILFEKLKLPIIKKTKTGISTDEEVLTKLAKKHPLPETLLSYRELSKLKSTYIDNLPALINPATGRVHTSFNQTITATGRLSSSGPNLQNIPVKTEEGRKIRKAFIASCEDSLLISADYSQIELRILAHLSGDDALIKAFREGLDVHAYTASLVFGVAETEVTAEMRGMAKTVNFGIIYGMSAFGLSQGLGIDVDKAKEFIDAYFKRYPTVKTYLDGLVEKARKDGYVSTLFGRRRFIPEINSPDIHLRQFAQRTAINAPIQGTAADIVKVAMICIQSSLAELDPEARMTLQVHDELVFDVPQRLVKEVSAIIKDRMEHVVELKVPIEVKIEIGKNWLEMEPAVV